MLCLHNKVLNMLPYVSLFIYVKYDVCMLKIIITRKYPLKKGGGKSFPGNMNPETTPPCYILFSPKENMILTARLSQKEVRFLSSIRSRAAPSPEEFVL